LYIFDGLKEMMNEISHGREKGHHCGCASINRKPFQRQRWLLLVVVVR
jgi:hypothetical protein